MTSIWKTEAGNRFARRYKEWEISSQSLDQKKAKFISAIHAGGSLLDVGVGTGSVAALLARTGCLLTVLDVNGAMLDEASKIIDSDSTAYVCKDFLEYETNEKFDTIYAVNNVLFEFLSVEDQKNFFRKCSRLLSKNGKLIIETYLISDRMMMGIQPIFFEEKNNAVYFTKQQIDCTLQTIRYTDYLLDTPNSTFEKFEYITRYSSPPEIDLMASLSGLVLSQRYSDWEKAPYTHLKDSVISTYEHRVQI